jgi:hypothetical protein
MFCTACIAERVVTGSGRVLPALRRRLPLAKYSKKVQWLTMPAILVGAVVLAFVKPPSLWAMVPLWLFFAHKLGYARHIHEEEPDVEEEREGSPEGAEDPGDGGEGQQSVEAREEGLTASRH